MDYAKRVEELLKMPQSLCNMCGLCCKIASFKGGMTYEEILALSKDESNPSQAEGARDFLTIFEPIEFEEALNVAPSFVKEFIRRFPHQEGKKCFLKCKLLVKKGDKSICAIHEDRPTLCRMYPIPHERTIYHDECGFKEQGQKNWQEIVDIMTELQEKSDAMQREKDALEKKKQS